jgi:hypothetical protein
MADVIQHRVMCEDVYRVWNLKNEKVEEVQLAGRLYFRICLKVTVDIKGENVDAMIHTH